SDRQHIEGVKEKHENHIIRLEIYKENNNNVQKVAEGTCLRVVECSEKSENPTTTISTLVYPLKKRAQDKFRSKDISLHLLSVTAVSRKTENDRGDSGSRKSRRRGVENRSFTKTRLAIATSVGGLNADLKLVELEKPSCIFICEHLIGGVIKDLSTPHNVVRGLLLHESIVEAFCQVWRLLFFKTPSGSFWQYDDENDQ
ncbi:unnamed protein product, partial [Acanthoscelides obtectus]